MITGISKYIYIVFITIISLQGLYVFKLSNDVETLNEDITLFEVREGLLVEEGGRLRKEIENINIVNNDLKKINVEYKEQVKIFREHDFENLSKAKPKLMENRANEATKRIFESIACHSGDTGLCK